MNLYPHDHSELFTEYGKRKSQECYEIEAQQKEKALDDGEQEGNEYQIPVIRSGHQKRDEEVGSMMFCVCPDCMSPGSANLKFIKG